MFGDFDTQVQCEEVYEDPDFANMCTAQLGGNCNGCGECAIEDCVDTCPQEGM